MMVDLKACNEIADSLKAEIETRKLISINDNKIIDKSELQIENLKEQIKGQGEVIQLVDKQSKRKDRRIKFQKIIIWVEGVGLVVVSGYTVVKTMFTK